MALDIAGFIIAAVGVAGIVYFNVKVLAGRGRQQALNAQLQGLAPRDRRRVIRSLERGQQVPSALAGAALPVAQQLAGLRPLARATGALAVAMVGLIIQPPRDVIGEALHIFLSAVVLFNAAVAILLWRRSSIGRRFLRAHGTPVRSTKR